MTFSKFPPIIYWAANAFKGLTNGAGCGNLNKMNTTDKNEATKGDLSPWFPAKGVSSELVMLQKIRNERCIRLKGIRCTESCDDCTRIYG